jgi:hypothetical protein
MFSRMELMMPMLLLRPVEEDCPTFMLVGMRQGMGRKAWTEAKAMRKAQVMVILNMVEGVGSVWGGQGEGKGDKGVSAGRG